MSAEVVGRAGTYEVTVSVDQPDAETKAWAERSISQAEGPLGSTEPPEGLVPRRFGCACTCGDPTGRCVHAAATLYAFGYAVDDDPRNLLRLDGLNVSGGGEAEVVDEVLAVMGKDNPKALPIERARSLFPTVEFGDRRRPSEDEPDPHPVPSEPRGGPDRAQIDFLESREQGADAVLVEVPVADPSADVLLRARPQVTGREGLPAHQASGADDPGDLGRGLLRALGVQMTQHVDRERGVERPVIEREGAHVAADELRAAAEELPAALHRALREVHSDDLAAHVRQGPGRLPVAASGVEGPVPLPDRDPGEVRGTPPPASPRRVEGLPRLALAVVFHGGPSRGPLLSLANVMTTCNVRA